MLLCDLIYACVMWTTAGNVHISCFNLSLFMMREGFRVYFQFSAGRCATGGIYVSMVGEGPSPNTPLTVFYSSHKSIFLSCWDDLYKQVMERKVTRCLVGKAWWRGVLECEFPPQLSKKKKPRGLVYTYGSSVSDSSGLLGATGEEVGWRGWWSCLGGG